MEQNSLVVDGLAIGVERSRRRTVSLCVTPALNVLVRAPRSVPDAVVEQVVRQHRRFIETHLCLQREQNENARVHPFGAAEVQELKPKAEKLARERLAYYAPLMGLLPESVRITSARTRWGSCSCQNRLCFSARIALLPPEAADYIIVHELVHIAVKNHGPRFYKLVGQYLPDYRRRIALVREAERRLGVLGR